MFSLTGVFVALLDLIDEMLLPEALMIFSNFMVEMNTLRPLHLGKPLILRHMSTSKPFTSILHSPILVLPDFYSLTAYVCAKKYHGFSYI